MRQAAALLLAALVAAACSSPEAARNRGQAGADLGNRTEVIEIHGRTDPGHDTPQVGKASGQRAVAGFESGQTQER